MESNLPVGVLPQLRLVVAAAAAGSVDAQTQLRRIRDGAGRAAALAAPAEASDATAARWCAWLKRDAKAQQQSAQLEAKKIHAEKSLEEQLVVSRQAAEREARLERRLGEAVAAHAQAVAEKGATVAEKEAAAGRARRGGG